MDKPPQIELTNERELLDRLRALADGLERPGELLDAIGAALESQIAIRLDETKEDPSGNRWEDIRASTRKQYESRYRGQIPGSLLDRTSAGGMRNSLTHNVKSRELEVGFGTSYAIWHELGTSKMVRRGLLTADPVAGTLGQEDREEILAVIELFLAERTGQ